MENVTPPGRLNFLLGPWLAIAIDIYSIYRYSFDSSLQPRSPSSLFQQLNRLFRH